MYKNLIVIFAISCCLHFTAAGLYPQYFQAYRNKYCVGPATNFLETTTNITDEYPGVTFLSTSVRGLWSYVDDTRSGIRSSLYGTRTCWNRDDVPSPVLKSVQKLATGDLDDSVLTLYILEDFKGEPLVIDKNGVGKVDRVNFKVGSWALTGAQSFTIFDAENFTGTATCLEVEYYASQDGFGITLNQNSRIELEVKSAKIGCDGGEMTTLRRDSMKNTVIT